MNAPDLSAPFLAAALRYSRRGWKVFPVMAGSKGRDANGRSAHLLTNGHLGATDDAAVIIEWWTRWPDANIGVSLAASGLVALDSDTYKPDCQWETFIRGRDMPATLVQRSARGGRHYIFLSDPDVRFPAKLCDGVEIKHKGYILLEPSTFEGARYRFEADCDSAPVPDWVPRRPESEARSQHAHRQIAELAVDNGSGPSDCAKGAEVEELLSWIDPDGDGYDAWVGILQALHDHFDGRAEGLAVADTWSRRGAKYKDGEVGSKWSSFQSGGGITLRSLAARARSNGADLSELARRHRGRSMQADQMDLPARKEIPDLSHDDLALDLGSRSWDADARYVDLWGNWLFWSGEHWQRDETLDHLTKARSFLRMRSSELLEWAQRKADQMVAMDKPADADRLMNWARSQARSLKSSATVIAVSNLARANPAIAARHTDFDCDPYRIGTPGGTVDLRTGKVRSARREDMISRLTRCAPAAAGVSAHVWERFLTDIFEGDRDTIAFLQRAAGYALTGLTSEHKLLFLHGAGRNGKSVFLNTLLDIWGAYGRRVAATTFLNSHTERHPTDVAGLQGARLAIASELPRGKTWDEATIKDLTGGDRLTARFMRQDFFDFDPQMTLMIAGNTQPSFRGVDEAIRSRVVLVPFAVTIPKEERDLGLSDKLKGEAPAILRWCIDGALSWQERGLDVPQSIAAASQAYFDEEDTLGQFLIDETDREAHAFTSSNDLSLRFNYWCDRQGLGAWTQRTLIKELRQRGFEDARSNRQRGVRGLRLK